MEDRGFRPMMLICAGVLALSLAGAWVRPDYSAMFVTLAGGATAIPAMALIRGTVGQRGDRPLTSPERRLAWAVATLGAGATALIWVVLQ